MGRQSEKHYFSQTDEARRADNFHSMLLISTAPALGNRDHAQSPHAQDGLCRRDMRNCNSGVLNPCFHASNEGWTDVQVAPLVNV